MTKSFGATSTTDEVLAGIDLSGKRVLVTGVSAGLGVETARALAAHGAQVVGAARDLAKAEAALRSSGARTASSWSSSTSARSPACVPAPTRCAPTGEPLDLIIANAGVMAAPFGHTADGFELQFGTNHLGHFVLVNRIAPLLRPGARLVNLSSAGHRRADVDLEDPNFERTPYDPWVGYGRAKTANILFAVEFDRRHRERGVRAAAVHPGGIRTELSRHLEPEALEQLVAGIDAELAAQGLPPYRVQDCRPGCRDQRMGRRGGTGGRGRRALLRGLPRDHAGHRRPDHGRERRCAPLCPRPGACQGALGQERGDGRRTLLG